MSLRKVVLSSVMAVVGVSLMSCATARDVESKGLLTPKLSFTIESEARESAKCSSIFINQSAKEPRAEEELNQLRKSLKAAGYLEAANADCKVTLRFERKSPATGSITIGFLMGYTHTIVVTAIKGDTQIWTTRASVMIEDEDRRRAVAPLFTVAKDFYGKSANTTISRTLQSKDDIQESGS